MKRVLSVLLILAVTAACGNGGSGGNDTPEKASSSEITVITPFAEGDGHREGYLSLVAGFEAESGIKVNDLSNERSSEKWKADMAELFESGGEPDVIFFFNGVTAASIIESGKVMDLDTIKSVYPDYALNIKLGVLNSMKYPDGKNYCVPVTGFWEGCFVNMALLEENGIKYPETFEELVACCVKLQEKGIVPIAANLKDTPHYLFEYLVYNYTGPSGHKFSVTEGENYESWAKGLRQFNVLYEAGAFPEDLENVTDEAALEMFLNKEAAFMVDGSWSPVLRESEGAKVGYFPAPEGGRRINTDIIGGFSMGYYLTQKGWENNQDAAVSFIEYMTNDDACLLFNKGGSASPGSDAEKNADSPILSSAAELIASSTAFVPAVQDSFEPSAREYLFKEIINIARGEKSPEEVLDTFIGMSN